MLDLNKLKYRIDQFCQNKVNAFSPTLSPAPKSVHRNEIESPFEALKYYYLRGVREFIVQKKYMGSYCDIYLHKDIQETYFVSRNGYRITHIDTDKAIEACADLHARFDWSELDLVIIQAEMMPWSIMGKNLIKNEFGAYLDAQSTHHDYLTKSNLYEKLALVKASEAYKTYEQDVSTLESKDLKKKYPSHIVRQYDAMKAMLVLNLGQLKEGIDVFAAQIAHFGAESDLHFKPFNMLKKVYSNGKEEINDDNGCFAQLSDDPYLTFRIDDEAGLETQAELVGQWLNTLTSNIEEGIVIKPKQAFLEGIPPAFKVRNNNYLMMIYGVNFMNEFQYNFNRRNISKKVKCSINDWKLNKALLEVRYEDVHSENYYLKNLIYDRILGETAESALDTRL